MALIAKISSALFPLIASLRHFLLRERWRQLIFRGASTVFGNDKISLLLLMTEGSSARLLQRLLLRLLLHRLAGRALHHVVPTAAAILVVRRGLEVVVWLSKLVTIFLLMSASQILQIRRAGFLFAAEQLTV